MKPFIFAVAVTLFILAGAGAVPAKGDIISSVQVRFNTNALGLGNDTLNDGNTVDPDQDGKFYTSPTTGQGSFLLIQTSGIAGTGTLTDPVLATITASTHLDVTTGVPSPSDYQAGILNITKSINGTPPGAGEGLGVRAFTVTGSSGLRQFSGGVAKIEGSKEISGGTDSSVYDPLKPDGAPHVDEEVLFTFNPLLKVSAKDATFSLSLFDTTDKFDMHIHTTTGGDIVKTFVGTGDPFMSLVGDSLWNVNFSDIPELTNADDLDWVTFRAVDDDPANPSGTAEHFRISGFTDLSVSPEPATLILMGLGSVGLLLRRRSRR